MLKEAFEAKDQMFFKNFFYFILIAGAGSRSWNWSGARFGSGISKTGYWNANIYCVQMYVQKDTHS